MAHVLLHAGFGIEPLDRHDRIGGLDQNRLHPLLIDFAIGQHREPRRAGRSGQHGIVFDPADEPLAADGAAHGNDRRFARAAGKDYLAVPLECLGHPLAGFFQRRARGPARRMRARWIGPLGEPFEHRAARFGAKRGGCGVVKIDRIVGHCSQMLLFGRPFLYSASLPFPAQSGPAARFHPGAAASAPASRYQSPCPQ